MATRSTFRSVNYFHRSDIYVRLTRTNLQSNSHYQKKKKNSFKFYFGNYRLYISFYFISAKRPRKVLWVHTTKKQDKFMIWKLTWYLGKLIWSIMAYCKSTIMIHCQLSLLNHIKNNRETENRSAHHKHRHQS